MTQFSLAASLLALTCISPHIQAQSAYYQPGGGTNLKICDPGDPTQVFVFGTAGSTTIIHSTSGMCLEGFSGSDYGWQAGIQLRTCIPNHPLQQWVVDTVGGTIKSNYTPLLDCVAFTHNGANLNTAIYASTCNEPELPGERFSFTIATTIQALKNDGSESGNCVSVAQQRTSYTLNDATPGALGAPFDGIGLVAAAGTARLLFDYPEAQQSAILDLLFSPTTGLGTHLLKVEIGSSGMATQGAEPAHQNSAGEASQAATRGTQVWLAQQAKARNPNIKLYALPYGWPGWLRQSDTDTTPFGDPLAAASYVVNYLQACSQIGVNFDYVGVFSDIWDDALSPSYVKVLRTTLDESSLSNVQIVCADVNYWPCAAAALSDSALMSAVGLFGDHGFPGNQKPNSTGKTLWNSWFTADSGNLAAAPKLAATLNTAYVNSNLTGGLAYAAMSSSYSTLPEWNYGMVLADQPWSGFYHINPAWFAIAHTSQFNSPGWQHLNVGFGSGLLSNGGSYVTRVDTSSGKFSWATVFVKNGGTISKIDNEMATISLGGNISPMTAQVYLFTSCFGATGTNASFFQGPTTLTVDPGLHTFDLFMQPNCIYTVTNQQGVGVQPTYPANPFVAPSPFPTTYQDDFSSRNAGNPGLYWFDLNGAFEVVDDPDAGRALRQQTQAGVPITRRNTDTRPHTILGDPTWQDIDFTVDIYLTSATDEAGVCVRCNAFNDTAGVDGSSGVDEMPGIWLFVGQAEWNLLFNLKKGTVLPVRDGPLKSPLSLGSWHTVRLIVREDTVIGMADGYVLFRQNVSYLIGATTKGFVGLAAGAFGQFPMFGSFSVNVATTACTRVPTAGTMPHEESCAAGTVGQQLAFVPVPGATNVGQFQLVADTTLCMQANSSADPDYRYTKTRAITLQPCNTTENRQYFMIENTTSTDGASGAPGVGPIQAIDGGVLNLYANSLADNSDIAVYPWQGGTNEYFTWDASTGTIYATFMGTCLSFCETE